LKYAPFPWAQNFQDGAHQTTRIFEKGTIFSGHPVHGMVTYVQEPLELGRRGSMGRRLNGNTLAAVNGHLRSLRESVVYESDMGVGVGVPATVIS
jgi:hypothetical protein